MIVGVLNMDKMTDKDFAMKTLRHMMSALAILLVAAGSLAFAPRAQASERCLYGSCDPSGAKERLFGPRPGNQDVTKRGYNSWNDNYNQRNQDRYRSGIKAKPFDFGSSADPAQRRAFNSDVPEARSEHVRWCLKRYRSYAVESNTYVTYGGRTRYCDSPFN